MLKFLPENVNKQLGLRLLFSLLTLLLFVTGAFMAYNVLYKNSISNDQCAWREIPGRTDAFYIKEIVPGGVAERAGLKDGDILLKINGQEITSDRMDTSRHNPMNIINKMDEGNYATYLIEREGQVFEAQIQILKIFDIQYFANLLLGVVFLFVGFIVVMTKPRGKTQRQFYYYSAFMMLSGSLSNFNTTFVFGIQFWFVFFLVVLAATRSLAPVYFLNFFYYFPIYRKAKYVKYLLSFVFLFSLAITLLGLFREDVFSPDSLRIFANNFTQIFFIAGLVIFTVRYFKYVPVERRKPLKPILYSSILSIASYFYLVYLQTTSDMIIFLKPHLLLPSLFIILLPVAFGYSIFRYRLMDFEIVVKKSIIYGIVTAAIAAIYVLFVFGLGSLVGEIFGQGKNQTLSIIAILIIAFIFDPLKRFVQNWIDKVFYRERYNYQKTLLDFSKNLPLQVDMVNILNSVADTITETMHVDKLSVVVFDNEGKNIHTARNVQDGWSFNGDRNGLRELLTRTQEPQNVPLLREEAGKFRLNENELMMLERQGIELSIPMLFQDKLVGMINTGKKKSGSFYSQEDIDLLSTVASQTAIAIENSRLYEKERSLERVQHEMNLASQIQLEWLPKESPDIPGYIIAGRTIPARIVGGDYFDYIQDKDKLIICIGDVSGKGLPAALLMANMQAILRSQSAQNCKPNICISNTNNLLFKSSRDDMFVTLFYGVLDLNTNTLNYTNAGHNYPLLIKPDNSITALNKGGLVIGVRENTHYEESSVHFEEDDILILYSDGISEAMDDSENIYGEERIITTVINNKHTAPDEIIDILIEDVKLYTGDDSQFDDMTLVVCKKS